uniref:Tetratricopeptide repeat protein 38 n=1 Tax=Corethron hystrix TaxID=216773 RepID=A0A7S1BDH7_9STRA|mmetsp:Transcript_21270/g.48320  ORF Transcript_21270/g.48320 Transcript_21270/m.48320 type:complete len:482 (+) Transcript_21270:111-1556(+)
MSLSPDTLPDHTGIPVIAANTDTINLLHHAMIRLLSFDDDFGTSSTRQATSTDKTCVMGLVMEASIRIVGGSPPNDSDIQGLLDQANKLLENVVPSIGIRERRLIEAASLYWKGQRHQAIDVWESLIYESELLNDVFAARMLSTAAFFTGESQNGRIAQATETMLRAWDNVPTLRVSEYRPYLLSMCAFGLVEQTHYEEAEKKVLQALVLYPSDIWAIHTWCHIMLEQGGRVQEALHMLSRTENKWKMHEGLLCHMYWHWALFHIEARMYENALKIFDKKILPAVEKSDGYLLDLVDAVSLLWRLELLNQPVDTHRWTSISMIKDRQAHPLSSFLQYSFCGAHVLVLLCHTDPRGAMEFMQCSDSHNSVVPSCATTDALLLQHQPKCVGLVLCQALYNYFCEGKFEDALAKLLSLRHCMSCIGGSRAQQDVFHQTLISSAIRLRRLNLASSLVTERYQTKQSLVNQAYIESINHLKDYCCS